LVRTKKTSTTKNGILQLLLKSGKSDSGYYCWILARTVETRPFSGQILTKSVGIWPDSHRSLVKFRSEFGNGSLTLLDFDGNCRFPSPAGLRPPTLLPKFDECH
jgi:hypothetical protein